MNKKVIKIKFIRFVFVISVIGIILAFLSAILYLTNCSWSNSIGVFSTIISIVLGLVSIIYTYISGEKTIQVLDEIEKQNKSLVNKIVFELSDSNFDEVNIESLLDK